MLETNVDSGSGAREKEIEAKRIARRKNILQNAKVRLEKINGKVCDPAPTNRSSYKTDPDPRDILPDHAKEQHFFDDLISHSQLEHGHSPFTMEATEDIIGLLERLSHTTTNTNDAKVSTYASQTPKLTGMHYHVNTPSTDYLMVKLIKLKVHIAIISALTYILFITENSQFVSYSVFLPLLIWEIADVYMQWTQDSTESSFIQLFLLAAIRPHQLMAITKVMNTLNKIFKDVGVFVFFFVLNHLFYCTLFESNEIKNEADISLAFKA